MVGSASTASQTEQQRLNKALEPAKMDLSGRKPCLKGTRRKIIDPILHWADDSFSDVNMRWLCGDAGFGKSTIANSVAREFPRPYAVYLFFDRNDPTSSHPSLVIRTIAYKLAIYNTNVRVAILEAIVRNPKIATESLATQFTKLLHEPLTACRAKLGSPLLVILDALDECGDAKTRRVLVELIAKRFTSLPPSLKFLITSRPDSDIVEPFTTSQNINRIHRVQLLPSTEDVLKFLYDGTRRIRETRPSSWLLDDWPGRPMMLKFSRYMEGVFILASTVVLFLENAFNPESCLEYLLMSKDVNSIERLHSLYATVLESAGDWKNVRFVDEFRAIFGAVIVGQVPMTVLAIDQLLALKCSSSTILSSFRFLLRYSESQPIRILHASIADYLTDPRRCGNNPWFINISDQHRSLARCCLRLMKERLRFNICNLETSHMLNQDVPDLPQRVQNSIPESLAYACQHFVTHVHLSNTEPYDFDGLSDIESFLRSRLLFWLEALGLVDEDKAAIPAMETLERWYRNRNEELADLAYDVVKFMSVFRGIVSQSTPHLYISAVPMWRQSSHLRRVYGHKFREIVRQKNGGVEHVPSLQSVLTGHTYWVTSVGFSPDGKRIVSGSYDDTVRIWDAETGSVVAGPFKGHTDSVASVCFSPNGMRVVSGSNDWTVRIWDLEAGSVVTGPFKGHTSRVASVGFSPDGKRIVSGSFDRTVLIWDAETGSVVAGPFIGHAYAVTSVGFSLDGERVVSGSNDETVRVWDAKTGFVVAGPFKGHTDWVSSVAFSPDGKLVVSGSKDRTVRIWGAETGSVMAGPFKHTNQVTSVGFASDGRRVVSGSYDRTVCIWDVETQSVVAGPLKGHTSFVTSVGFSPDGKRVVSGSDDRTVRIWDAETSPVVVGSFDSEEHTDRILSVGFAPDGRRVVSGSDDETMRIWDAETGSLMAGPFKGHTSSVTSVRFSPDGKRVVSGSFDRTVRIWDAETGFVVAGPFNEHKSVASVGFSPDGRRVASGSFDNTVQVWDTETGTVVAGPFKGHTNSVTSVEFSPDGKRVVSGSFDKTVQVWDVDGGTVIGGPFKGHTNRVTSVGFSHDGKLIVSGSDDNTARVWDAKTGSVVGRPFKGHTAGVTSVGFSPDGTRVVSGSVDDTVQIWDVKTGSIVAGPFKGHTNGVTSVGFSPDGKYIASGSEDKTVRIWDAEHESVMAAPFGVHDSQLASHNPSTWKLHEDGWLRSPSGALVLWIPHYYLRSALCLPPTTVVIGVEMIQFDTRCFVHGERWTECFDATST